MDLDVLMPFHRLDKFLIDAIDSLNTNKKVKFRLIAVDDRRSQSEDASIFFSKVTNLELVRTRGGQGYGASLKEATKYITSDTCALMNSDDVVHPERFKLQLEALNDGDVSISKLERISSKGRRTPSLAGAITSDTYNPILLLFGSYGADASWCVSSDWWKRKSFFDQSDALDWRIALKTFKDSRIVMSNQPLYFYRKHKAQLTSWENEKLRDYQKLFETWDVFAKSFGIKNNSRNVFNALATPWAKGNSVNFDELAQWLTEFSGIKKELNSQISRNIEVLINRRLLIASVDQNLKLKYQIRLLYMAKTAAPGLTLDILRNIRPLVKPSCNL